MLFVIVWGHYGTMFSMIWDQFVLFQNFSSFSFSNNIEFLVRAKTNMFAQETTFCFWNNEEDLIVRTEEKTPLAFQEQCVLCCSIPMLTTFCVGKEGTNNDFT